jgi:hypothetical protein
MPPGGLLSTFHRNDVLFLSLVRPVECDLDHFCCVKNLLRDRKGDWYNNGMNAEEFRASLRSGLPPDGLAAPSAALWWDAKGDWGHAHGLVDELETLEGMAVHAYLHRKEGAASNADYWYGRAGRGFQREKLQDEWAALVEGLAG